MKLASIDIGTNTTRLLIAEPGDDRSLKTVLRLARITRLGEGVDTGRAFKPGAIKRTLDTLSEFKQILEAEGVVTVRVIATSAARDARDVAEFVEQAGKIGFEVEILTGPQEAQFAFNGATYDAGDLIGPTRYLVIDIGGGSTEFILGREGKTERLYSFDIGSVRLTEMFFRTDPPAPVELEKAQLLIRTETGRALSEFRSMPLVAIGVAGTITTIAAVQQEMAIYDPEKIHHFKLTAPEIEEILQRFLSLPLEKRKKLPGLEPARADIIIAGTLILLEALRLLGLSELIVSEHDLLDGLILSLL